MVLQSNWARSLVCRLISATSPGPAASESRGWSVIHANEGAVLLFDIEQPSGCLSGWCWAHPDRDRLARLECALLDTGSVQLDRRFRQDGPFNGPIGFWYNELNDSMRV